VRIYYESRLAKVNLSKEGKQLVEKLDDELVQDDLTDTQKPKAKWTQLEALIGSEDRIKNIAQDIVSHFEQRQEVSDGKGMIVAMSRRIAADLYAEIIKIKPKWHCDIGIKRKGFFKIRGNPQIINNQATRFIFINPIHPCNRLHQIMSLHRLINIQRMQTRSIKAC
jgi:hypothetical protein